MGEITTTADREVGRVRLAVKIAAVEAISTWVVKRSLEFGYRKVTGRALPTARDRDDPFGQVLFWATVSAAALTATTVIADQTVLRSKPR